MLVPCFACAFCKVWRDRCERDVDAPVDPLHPSAWDAQAHVSRLEWRRPGPVVTSSSLSTLQAGGPGVGLSGAATLSPGPASPSSILLTGNFAPTMGPGQLGHTSPAPLGSSRRRDSRLSPLAPSSPGTPHSPGMLVLAFLPDVCCMLRLHGRLCDVQLHPPSRCSYVIMPVRVAWAQPVFQRRSGPRVQPRTCDWAEGPADPSCLH